MDLLWRVGFRFETAAQAEGAYAELDADSEIEAVGASLSLAGPTLYAYAPSQASIERSMKIIRSHAIGLSDKPVSCSLDKWLGNRWSLDYRGQGAEERGLLDWVGDALNSVPPLPID